MAFLLYLTFVRSCRLIAVGRGALGRRECDSRPEMDGIVAESEDFLQNKLLSIMPDEAIQIFRSDWKWIQLRQGDRLSRPNVSQDFAYFPLSGICSYIAVSDDDVRVEAGLIGNEGFVGSAIVLQAQSDPNEVTVQANGTALRLSQTTFSAVCEEIPETQIILLQFTHILMIQSTQTAIANARCTIEIRLARWLLMYADRVGPVALPITHSFLSMMLAVRRSGVTDALHSLEGRHLLKSFRGHVQITDRQGLELLAGGAYGLPEREYSRLIGQFLENGGHPAQRPF